MGLFSTPRKKNTPAQRLNKKLAQIRKLEKKEHVKNELAKADAKLRKLRNRY